MGDIAADAKAWLSDRDSSTLRTHSENCHQWHAECLVARLVAEVERHKMTEEERALVADAAGHGDYCHWAMALRGYLDRTAPEAM